MSVHFIFMNGLLDSFRSVVFVNRVILREVVHGCPLELHLIFQLRIMFLTNLFLVLQTRACGLSFTEPWETG